MRTIQKKMSKRETLGSAAIAIACALGATTIIAFAGPSQAAEENELWLYSGGWSKHAEGVGFQNETHNTVGLEYNDWMVYTYNNSNNDETWFFGKSTEDISYDTSYGKFSAGVAYGCIYGYTPECLAVVVPGFSYESSYIGANLRIIPNTVTELDLRIPLHSLYDMGSSDTTNGFTIIEEDTRFAIGMSAGSTGAGYQFLYPINKHFTIGLGHESYDVDSEHHYDASVNISNTHIDWHPFKGGLFISLGAVNSDTSINFSENIAYTHQGMPLRASGSASIELKGLMPYYGIGFQQLPEKALDLGWRLDLGVIKTGGPRVSTTITHNIPDQLYSQFPVEDMVHAEVNEFTEKYPLDDWKVLRFGVYLTF